MVVGQNWPSVTIDLAHTGEGASGRYHWIQFTNAKFTSIETSAASGVLMPRTSA